MSSSAGLDASDLRTGGKWTPLQRAKNALIRCAIRVALAGADRLPAEALLRIGRVIGWLAYWALGGARSTALQNLGRALPGADLGAIARRAFMNAGENLGSCLLLRRRAVRALEAVFIGEQSLATFREALAEGRGVVFVSAHLGPFELIPAAIAELGVTPAIVVRESYDPSLDAVVDAHRLARGLEVIHRGYPGMVSKMMRALRAGRPVGFLPDLGGRVASLPALFLGRRVSFPAGPQRIARRLRCPLLVGTLGPPSDPRFNRRFSLVVTRIDTSGTDEVITRRVADCLSRAITQMAEHWLWMAPLRSLRTQDG